MLGERAILASPAASLRRPGFLAQLAWEQHGDELALRWSECGGPCPQPPINTHHRAEREGAQDRLTQKGLGMRIIRASVETQLCGSLEFDWRPDGLVCAIRVPCYPKTGLLGDFLHSIQKPAPWRRQPAPS